MNLDRPTERNFLHDGYSNIVMVGVSLPTDFPLDVCAVRSEERGSWIVVYVRSSMYLSINYFNTKPTECTICYERRGVNCIDGTGLTLDEVLSMSVRAPMQFAIL